MDHLSSVEEEARKERIAPRSTVIGAQNIPASGPAILVANHVSESDAELLNSAITRAVHFDTGADRLLHGELFAIFPEGAPSRTGCIESFGPEVEALMAANPNVVIIPASICQGSAATGPVVLIGAPLETLASAAQLRQKIVELSCEAIEHCQGPDSTLAYRLIETARSHWDKPAIADSSQRHLTYGEVLTQAFLISNWLQQETRAGEQNIGVYLPASVDAAIANYSISLAGKTAVNLNFTAGEQNCRLAAGQCELQTILTSASFLQRTALRAWPEMVFLEDLQRRFTIGDTRNALSATRFTSSSLLTHGIRPDSPACILFSSGSTGIPKGIELTHWNILANADGFAAKIPPAIDDCMLGVLPFFHSFGYTFALWFPLLQGFRAVYHASPTDALTIGRLAETHRATFFLSTPTFCLQYARKLKPNQFASLKYIIVGAEKLRDSVADEFRRHFGLDLLAGYGCTELGPGVAINIPDVVHDGVMHCGTRPGSVGRPLAGIAIRIVDPETYAPVPAGQQGLVLVKGPSRMPRYFRAPELTAEVLRDGYYITGDLGYLDDDGFLYISDRMARFSKIAGEMAPHLLIEEIVSDLTPCFVTGIPDNRRGERLVMIYTNQDITAAGLYSRLSSSGLPALWIPKRENICLVESIPVLATGKVNLKQARELAVSVSTDAVQLIAAPRKNEVI